MIQKFILTLWNRTHIQKRKNKKQKALDWEICGTITYFSGWIHSSEKSRHSMGIFYPYHPIHRVGPDIKHESSKPEGSIALMIFKMWLPYIGSSILNSSSERLCWPVLKRWTFGLRWICFVFGCVSRAPVILLVNLHTFLPTFVFAVKFFSCYHQIS